jgi:hypothetical protein
VRTSEWIAGGFAVGYVYAPRTTRLLAGLWTIHAIADGAQLAYSAAQQPPDRRSARIGAGANVRQRALLALEAATVARELVAPAQLLGHEPFSHASLLGLENARRASLAANPFPLDRRQRGRRW